ncbi:alpha/beta fold hydrolase [Sporichthya polymorpha]|uniref:alpha/beta fold hydrolase n=1 Tax=Sporichthya polymorpha TaxID=35751 RepID=UPI000374F0B0|nr:alpha/beta hydrolase [Sporichthya polymorpha]
MEDRTLAYAGSDGCLLYASVQGEGPLVLLLHGGGPDHRSLLPLAARLADEYTVALPDVRGYGRSRCADPARHTWDQYAADVVSLIDFLQTDRAVVGGTGLGGTIALRAGLSHPSRVGGLIVVSLEEIEDDEARAAETALMDRFAEVVRARGVAAGWERYLPYLQPLIANLVREALPRTDAASVAAAAATGRDRAFRDVADLASITAPTLIFAGGDPRHPARTATQAVDALQNGKLAPVGIRADLKTAEDLAKAVAPGIREFLRGHQTCGHRP